MTERARGTAEAPARAALEALVERLEEFPQAEFRAAAGPGAAIERRAAELGAPDLAMRARLLRAMAMVRDGKSGQGGRWGHEVLAWAEENDHPFLRARAHRTLSIFYRQVGDLAEGLSHAVQCLADLADNEPAAVRARHTMTLAVALDESGSIAEGARRFREALAIATVVGDTELTLNILNNMAYTAYEANDEPGARVLAGQMREVQARSGRAFGVLELDTIARIEMMGGHYGKVEETLHSVLDDGPDSVVESHEGDAPAVGMLTLAEARRLDHRYAAAQQALDAAVALTETRGLDRVRAQAREEQAALFAATGRFEQAYDEHRAFYRASTALHSAQREARARALQAVFETTEARRDTELFREMAYRDALTGLHNRRHVNERLPVLLAEAHARPGPISVASLDLDHFKRINDSLSHSVGDLVLQHIARLLQQEATGAMIAARMGGEEFLLIMPGVGREEAAQRCERLRLQVRAHHWEPITGTLAVTTSIGVATAVRGQGTASMLLSAADRYLYAAKRNGRDRVATGLDNLGPATFR